MVKKVDPERLNFRLEIGKSGTVGKLNPNTGESEKGFITTFTVWAGEWHLSFQQNLTLNGDESSNNAIFVVRHNLKIRRGMQIRRNQTQLFHIDNVDYDDGLPPDGFDLITCHEVNKHG